jgi:carbonic anhydrase/acetyltransferase-like protein (isoleucine patch superfamily)
MIRPFGGKTPRIDTTAFVVDGAIVLGQVEIGPQVSIWFGCVLRGDINRISIGARTNLQDGTLVHTDRGVNPTVIAEEVSVGHRVILHGCTVGPGALIGMGAVLLSGSEVGEGAIVGAGSVVPEGMTVPPGMLALGVPARVRRAVTDEERARCGRTVRNYLEYQQVMRDEGFGQPLEPFAP